MFLPLIVANFLLEKVERKMHAISLSLETNWKFTPNHVMETDVPTLCVNSDAHLNFKSAKFMRANLGFDDLFLLYYRNVKFRPASRV